jgi:hypothetical protein
MTGGEATLGTAGAGEDGISSVQISAGVGREGTAVVVAGSSPRFGLVMGALLPSVRAAHPSDFH